MVGVDVGRTGWPSQRWRADDATGLRRGIPTRRGARQLAAASIGPSLAGQTADVACRHGAQLARPSAAEARTRPPLGGQARRMGAQTGSRCGVGDRNTALPPACDGLPGTPWLLAPRRPLDKLDLFRLSQDGGLVFPFRRAHYQPAPDRP